MKHQGTSIFTTIILGFLILHFTPGYVAENDDRSKRQATIPVCRTPDNFYGICTTLTSCPTVTQLFGTYQGSPQIVNYLKGLKANCGNRIVNRDPVVCCQSAYEQMMATTPRVVPTRRPTRIRFTDRPIYTTLPPFEEVTTMRNPQTRPRPTHGHRPRPTQRPTQIPTEASTPSQRPRPTVITTESTSVAPTTQRINTRPPAPPTSTATSERLSGICYGPDAIEGTCKDLKQCPALLTQLEENQNSASFAQFLRQSNEICNVPPPIICCPLDGRSETGSEPPTRKPTQSGNEIIDRLPTPEEGCGVTKKSNTKIVGGTQSKLGDFPWIALLGYEDIENGIAFRCGGSLITQKHVLTAAHCIRRDLRLVRLGEHDLTTDQETNHMDIPIQKTSTYEKYDRRDGHSDLAMVYLQRIVPFSNLIRPICLPTQPDLQDENYVDFHPFVAGWGKTEEGGKSADILQELQIPVLENSVCQDRYWKQGRWLSQKQFNDAIICAGIEDGGKDTCQGDSGGPLMFPKLYKGKFYYVLIGVVSYGIGCARPEIPGVYTNVPHFIDWIQQKVAEP